VQILIYCYYIYIHGNVLGFLRGRNFLSVRYICFCNLDMYIDICLIYQIYLTGQKFTNVVFSYEGDFEIGILNSSLMNFVFLPVNVNLTYFAFNFLFFSPVFNFLF